MCCEYEEGFLSFLVQTAAVSNKTNKQKRKNEKKERRVFLGPTHNTNVVFQFTEPPSYSYHPHLIIVQKEGQTTNFNSLEKRRREGDGVRVSA